jgi:hypothetical protein
MPATLSRRPKFPTGPTRRTRRRSPPEHHQARSPGRHCHSPQSTLPLSVIGCHPLGIYTVILLPFSVKITVSFRAARR